MRPQIAALAVAAAAVSPWPAQTLSAPHEFVDTAAMAFAPDGTGLASWTWQDGTHPGASAGADAARRPAADAAFAAQQPLVAAHDPFARPLSLAGVAPYAAGRAVRVTVAGTSTLQAAFGGPAGGFGPERVVFRGRQILRSALAADARGDAVVAWWDRTGRSSRLYASVRRAGRRFGRPQRLAGHGFGDVAVAVSPRGAALVAWESGGAILTRARTPHGRAFAPARRANATPAPSADVAAGLARDGRSAVAWASQRQTEGGPQGTLTYAAALRRPGGRFAQEVLERHASASGAQAEIRLAVEPGGRVTVAWAGLTADGRQVRAATAARGAHLRDSQAVSPVGPGVVLGDLAAAGGRRLVVWLDGGADDAGQLMAATAPPGAAFGPPEAVGDQPRARAPRAAIDPLSGRPTVLWSERTSGLTTVARAATRAG
jgi:hypothetical protein